ncbi:ATP synthase subunit s, mitochondrial [Chionoecetes opilio]|uniref:ATP synthase subunit s, mitochondrial n=1 Tax=Chionoecetes opilio TaxID=41210 RepID=A0A8J4Y7K3_CHIOP|nr:ATP synthase subunit s, mitochondrial [Chionoecetes opilio]
MKRREGDEALGRAVGVEVPGYHHHHGRVAAVWVSGCPVHQAAVAAPGECVCPAPSPAHGHPHTQGQSRVDESRIKEVGPDRACAEWLLRCGAVVRWVDRDAWTKDYNSLPVGGGRGMKIEEIDATDSAVMHIGFPHFSLPHPTSGPAHPHSLLRNLDYLKLYDLPEIQDREAVLAELAAALPSCTIDFPYALAKDDPSLKDDNDTPPERKG